jgi:alpha/beta superfamily hydrolase
MKTQEIWFQGREAKLHGQMYIPETVPAPALLVCHGLNAKGYSGLRLYTRLAEKACKEGFVSLVFDFRGVGKSTGEFDYGFGEQDDVKCALDYLASSPEVLPKKVFIVGHSLGGAVSIYAAQNETRIKGLVLWSTPKNHDYNVKKFIRRNRSNHGLYSFLLFSFFDKIFDVSRLYKLEVYGVNLRPKYVKDKLMKLHESKAVSTLSNIPLLVVIGDTDDIVGVDEAQEIFASAREPKSLLIINGADHIYKRKEEELITKTIHWIKEWV